MNTNRPMLLAAALSLVACNGPTEPVACEGVIVADGNSLTDSSFNHPSWFSIVRDSLAVSYPLVTWYNVAQNGMATSVLRDTAHLRVDSLYPDKNPPVRLVVMWEITNDMALYGQTPSESIVNLGAYAADRHAKGWKVIVMSMLPREPLLFITTQARFELQRFTANDSLRASWTRWADGFGDVAADADLGKLNANLSGPLYRADRIHLTDKGQRRVAQTMLPAIQVAIEKACH